ncbi:MAG: DoxX-like family protein [Flavobacterium sp.]|uniref:DoxX-like family protein n=1 Tax=Flavobacterium sp. TaxID=239 RepID=UPI0032644A87
MSNKKTHKLVTVLIAIVWMANGLLCKVLGLVPRHQEIVERILSFDRSSAYFAIKGIGLLEVLMAIWILSNIKPRLNAIAQMIIIATMNILEFMLAPDLLLWGKFNSLFALLFILLIYYNEFYLHQKTNKSNAVIS